MKWKEILLKNTCECIVDCPHSTPKWTDEGVLVLRNYNIRNGKLDLSDVSYTTEEGYIQRTQRAVPQTGDLIFTREAPMGEICILPKGLKCCLGQRMVMIRPDKKIVDNHYLLFAMQSDFVKHQISWSEGTGSTVSNIRIPVIENFRIPLPPLPEQRAIAEILSSIDDKIELNNQMNRTLEAMAQAIFKQWFVDFEFPFDFAQGKPALLASAPLSKRSGKGTYSGIQRSLSEAETNGTGTQLSLSEEGINVHASASLSKRSGKKTYSGIERSLSGTETNSTGIERSLSGAEMSSNMIESELGPIPEGWRVGIIDDVAEIVGGGTPSTKIESYFVKDAIPWITPKDLSGYTYKYIKKGSIDITEEALKNSSARLLPAGTVLFSSRAPIGYITIAANPVSTNQGFKSLIPKNGMKTEYLYQYIKMITPEIENRASGSTFKEISGSGMKQINIIIPDVKLIDLFEEVVKPLNEQIKILKDQSQTLSTLRDTLLPKLMSGELRVPEEIVKMYEEAVSSG